MRRGSSSFAASTHLEYRNPRFPYRAFSIAGATTAAGPGYLIQVESNSDRAAGTHACDIIHPAALPVLGLNNDCAGPFEVALAQVLRLAKAD